MKKVLLVTRLLLEAMVGLICMIAFREQIIIAILGYLGMPRRYHPAALQRFNLGITLGDFLRVTIILLIGALCFTDVFKIIRKLTASYHPS